MSSTIAENIKLFRGMRDLTQKQIADNTGLSVTFISQIENGISNPSDDSLEKIAKVLRVSSYDLKARNGFYNFKNERIQIIELLIRLTKENKINWNIKKGNFVKCKTEVLGNKCTLTFSETEHNNYNYVDLILENKEKNITMNFLDSTNDEIYNLIIELIREVVDPHEKSEKANQILNDLKSLLDE